MPETSPPASADERVTVDVAIVGAGYVGVPLAQVFADAGRSVLLVDIDAERVDALNRGESYIEDVPSEKLRELVEERGLRATTDYDELRDADAILIALPTPLSRQREPDLSIMRPPRARSPRACARDISSCSSRPPIRGRRAATCSRSSRRGSGLRRRRRLPPRVLARARRPRPHRLDDTQRPQGRRRRQRGVDRRRRGALRQRDRHHPPRLLPGGGGADEAAREHLPLGQHRARQRAGAALRPDGDRRVGGDRRRLDEAVRLHALRARAWPGRALHPDRPLLPHVEGPRVRLHDRVHRAGRARSTRTCPTTAARASRRRSTTARASRSAASRILVLGVAYKADISDMRQSPAVKLIELLTNAGSLVSYHDPVRPLLHRARRRALLRAARAGRLRRGRDRHGALVDRLRLARGRGTRWSSTCATRMGRAGIRGEKVWKL